MSVIKRKGTGVKVVLLRFCKKLDDPAQGHRLLLLLFLIEANANIVT